jgi:hypothetical protein
MTRTRLQLYHRGYLVDRTADALPPCGQLCQIKVNSCNIIGAVGVLHIANSNMNGQSSYVRRKFVLKVVCAESSLVSVGIK